MTIELRTGLDRPARREDYCTKSAACFCAKPGTPHPLWNAFLSRVTDHDEELQGFLKRFCGYCLTGVTTEHVLVFLYGTGANGKSVFVNTVAGILGDYAIPAPMELLLASRAERHSTEIARLAGVRLVTASEIASGRRWDEAKLKLLTGGDRLVGRFMRCDDFEFVPQFKLLISGNRKPALRALDEAIKRRFLLVPFTVCIPSEERDPRLFEKLKPEWPAILRWMADGCLEWQRNGLGVPAAVHDASASYFSEQDSLREWMDETLTTDDPRAWTKTVDLFTSWKDWCEARNLIPGSVKSFSELLTEQAGLTKKLETGTRRAGFSGVTYRAGRTTAA